MSVDTTEITSVYNNLFTSMVAKYDDMWASNKIDAETYANLVGQASSQLVQLSAELVQKQEQIEADVAIKAKQLEIMGAELSIKKSEADTAHTKMLASIDKEMGYTYSLDGEANIIRSSLVDSGDGIIDFERKLKEEQEKLMYTERVLKDKQAATEGMDNAMRIAQANREADPTYVYQPQYEESV